MADYDSDRRLFAIMRKAGWRHEPASNGFSREVAGGGIHRRLWVSWGQVADAVRLSEAGETVVGVVPQSETLARIVAPVANDG